MFRIIFINSIIILQFQLRYCKIVNPDNTMKAENGFKVVFKVLKRE